MRIGILLLVWVTACGGDSAVPQAERPSPAPPPIPLDAPLVAFLGDSISAGLHLPADEAFPAVLQREFLKKGKPFRLLNAGHSGDTTAGGLRRIEWILRSKPDIVVIELGANDGLRGQPVAGMRKNLDAILDVIDKAGARSLLLGMRIPTSYGAPYTESFARLFDDIARARRIAFVPFFMEPIAGRPEFFLEDQLHPNPEGHRKLAAKIAPALEQLLP